MPSSMNLTTQNGIPFSLLYDGYAEDFEDSASQSTAYCLCDWNDRTAWRSDILGYTQWLPGDTYLRRNVPYLNPQSILQYGHKCKLVKKGGVRDDGDGTLGDVDGWPNVTTASYETSFRRRPYQILTDDQGFSAGTAKEYQRYCNSVIRFTTRERVVPGLQLKLYNASVAAGHNVLIPNNGFYPDRTQRIVVTWEQIPVAAIPFLFIGRSTNCVNSVAINFTFGDSSFPMYCEIGSLLLKGLANEAKPYEGSTGLLYVDLAFEFDYRYTLPVSLQSGTPGVGANWWGWNGVPIPGTSGNYDQIVSVATGVPPYIPIDLQGLFIPGKT